MSRKRWIAALALAAIVLSLTACGKEETEDMAENDVDFNIEEQQDPGFSGTLGDVNSVGAEGEPVYEEDGGVAYEIDPVTLERISGPLDIDTHEPIDGIEEETLTGNDETTMAEEPSLDTFDEPTDTASSNPLAVDEPEEVEEPANDTTPEITSDTAGFTEATEYTKLPNTGKFLEDD